MAESAEDKMSRVQRMAIGDDGTWDLSDNDRAALRHVLGLVNAMATSFANIDGLSVPTELARFSTKVERTQANFSKATK